METPSTARRVTRSQAYSAVNNIPISEFFSGKNEDNGVSRSRKGKADPLVLIDITNDSPIGGLAVGRSETPASSKIKSKSRGNIPKTPCSGEAILRCQVKSLLQKVDEEETEHLKHSYEKRPFVNLRTLLNSPATLLAPTPANTPVISNPDLGHSSSSPANLIKEYQETVKISEVIVNPESNKSQESPVSRALLFDDSPGKTDVSSIISSTITCEEDHSSEWSVEVNANSLEEKYEEDGEDYEEEYQERGGGLIDELCEEFQAICVEAKETLPRFTGKHTRFIYNSDDEIEGEEDIAEKSGGSPGVLHLKGIPTPKGKHLRFHEEEQEDGEKLRK